MGPGTAGWQPVARSGSPQTLQQTPRIWRHVGWWIEVEVDNRRSARRDRSVLGDLDLTEHLDRAAGALGDCGRSWLARTALRYRPRSRCHFPGFPRRKVLASASIETLVREDPCRPPLLMAGASSTSQPGPGHHERLLPAIQFLSSVQKMTFRSKSSMSP